MALARSGLRTGDKMKDATFCTAQGKRVTATRNDFMFLFPYVYEKKNTYVKSCLTPADSYGDYI